LKDTKRDRQKKTSKVRLSKKSPTFRKAGCWSQQIQSEAALDLISPGACKRPAVLEMRFHICAQTDRWDEAYKLGKGCLFIEPDGLNGSHYSPARFTNWMQ
jgi:hypothetical protein